MLDDIVEVEKYDDGSLHFYILFLILEEKKMVADLVQ
jgi:hypothetical protein